MSKVVEYVGFFHALKDRLRERWTQYWHTENSTEEEKESNFRTKVKDKLEKLKQRTITRINHSSIGEDDFSHLTRTKTRMELVKISAAVMGIEFSYAAETAFVSPLLLNIGLRHRHMTLMWCLSPLLGFFVTPLLGSLSDGCRSRLGRRRPFIILLSIGIVLGLILVPNGKTIGLWLGDTYRDTRVVAKTTPIPPAIPTFLPPTIITTTEERPAEEAKVIQAKSLKSSWGDDSNKTNNPIEPPGKSVSMNNKDDPPPPPLAPFKRSPHHSVLDESGKRINYMASQPDDRDQVDILKNLKLKHKSEKRGGGQDSLDSLFQDALEEANSSQLVEQEPEEQEEGMNVTRRKRGVLNGTTTSGRNTSELTAESQTKGDKSVDYVVDSISNHPWGLIFTVIGTVLLDFDADACQSPSRAYMLDVTIPEDHARGLSTFTIMAGLGGSLGYFLGALNWENTFIGILFGGQVRAVFTLVLFIFIACVITTIRSFEEIPIDRLYPTEHKGTDRVERGEYSRFEEEEEGHGEDSRKTKAPQGYGATSNVQETCLNENIMDGQSGPGGPLEVPVPAGETEKAPTFNEYLQTIVQMPKSLQWLCVTNYFCWMSLVCYSLYFTDFVGEAVYGGDPAAPLGSETRTLYEQGVRFGCWGMSLYSLSCSIYSLGIEALVARFGARRVYIYGQLVYSVGMVLMGSFRARFGVIVFSWTAGIMYATLFTMPYLLVARYHAADTFEVDVDDLVVKKPSLKRGLGTDVAIVSSMVFLAQISQAITLGTVVTAAGSPTAIVFAAALFAACGSVAATKVLYLDL